MACKICEKECPPQCIYIVKSDDKKPDYMGKPQFYPKIFDIDISVCMSCQICVEVCPFEAIKMDKEFELSKRERFNHLLLRKKDLAKPNEYYHKICPTDAAEVDAKLTAHLKQRRKRKLPQLRQNLRARCRRSNPGQRHRRDQLKRNAGTPRVIWVWLGRPRSLAIADRKTKIKNPIARVAKLADAPELGLRIHRFQSIAFHFKANAFYEGKTSFWDEIVAVANGE